MEYSSEESKAKADSLFTTATKQESEKFYEEAIANYNEAARIVQESKEASEYNNQFLKTCHERINSVMIMKTLYHAS